MYNTNKLNIDKNDVMTRACEIDDRVMNKNNIMEIYCCENGKALKILRTMYQMGYAYKLGKGYYTTTKMHSKFADDMRGKEIYI